MFDRFKSKPLGDVEGAKEDIKKSMIVFLQKNTNLKNAETISDNELENIANIRSNEAFAVEINKLTSPLTLERLKQIATAAGKSVKKIQLIDSRIEALEDGDN
jgi:septum formation inhibitor MinC